MTGPRYPYANGEPAYGPPGWLLSLGVVLIVALSGFVMGALVVALAWGVWSL